MKKFFCFCILVFCVICCATFFVIFNAHSSTVVAVCKNQSRQGYKKTYGDATCYNGEVCGYGCNADGKNCKYGYCNISNCNTAKGYVELTASNYNIMICYNPNTKLAYGVENPGKVYFYKDGQRCGENCDYDGGNCKKGSCDASQCHKEYGYTDLKNVDKALRCYNPTTQIAYDFFNSKNWYYKNGGVCGINCDMNGKNCEIGDCTSLCSEKDGFIQKNDKCYNPKTHLAYTNNYDIEYNKLVLKSVSFWLNDEYCGANCDYDGQNCSSGHCNISSCNVQKGYTQLKLFKNNKGDDKLICYNPSEKRGYFQYSKDYKQFYVNGYRCGRNCDYDGRNCAVDNEVRYGDFIGICNVQDCPNGYKIVPDVFKAHGFCGKEGKSIVLLGADKKFHSAGKTQTLNGIKNGVAGTVFYGKWLLTGD